VNQPARARKKRQPLRHTTDIQGRFSRSSIFRVCRTREPSPCICTIAFNLFLFQFAITKKKSKKPYKNYPNRRNAHANPTPRRTREPSPCISKRRASQPCEPTRPRKVAAPRPSAPTRPQKEDVPFWDIFFSIVYAFASFIDFCVGFD